MGTILEHGRFVPGAEDPAEVIFAGLEKNYRLNDSHNHDGVNSAPIKTHALEKVTQTVVVDESSTDFTQGRKQVLVKLPEGFFTDLVHIDVRDEQKDRLYPEIQYVSADSFYFVTNQLGTYTFIYN